MKKHFKSFWSEMTSFSAIGLLVSTVDACKYGTNTRTQMHTRARGPL